MTNLLEVQHLSYQYEADGPKAIDDLNFAIKKGSWTAIIGRNGSGKSTTARLIDGLMETPYTGDIRVDGELLTPDNVWTIRRKIGMVFQNPDNQFVGSTVEDDVAFGLENQGIDRADMQKRVHEALELVGMLDFKEREPAKLSGGQKQRVALAGIIALRPELIILDEATSMLDPKGRKDMIKVIQTLKASYQLTVLSITHDLDEAALADEILMMQDGRLVSQTSPASLFSRTDLTDNGLDVPFVTSLANRLRQAGVALPDTYLEEEELITWLSDLKK